MKKALALFAAGALLAAAAPAMAEEPAPAKSQEHPAKAAPRLNLKLEEAGSSAAPRITFGAREEEKAPASSLPALGGSPTRAGEEKSGSRSIPQSSPYPADTNPYR